MQTKTKMVWLELIGGLFGWAWIIASIGFIYFLVVAIFGGGPWSRVAWAFGVGAIAKWLARGFNDHKARVVFTADLVAQGYTAEAAGEEWYAQYTGQKRVSTTALKPMTDDEAMKIINAYGNALSDRKSSFGDVSELPYAKERIKEAIIHGIKTADDPKVREVLKAGYITLADFQPGFGARRANAELPQKDPKDPKKMAALILAKGEDFLKLPQEVAAEADLLMVDLESLERTTTKLPIEKPSDTGVAKVVTDPRDAVLARQLAAQHLAVQFLRDEPNMAPGLAAKLREKMASDVPELFLKVQELSGQNK